MTDQLTQNENPLVALAQSSALRRLYRIACYGLLAGLVAVLLLVAAATLPTYFGYGTYVVNGASMEPALAKGSVALTVPTNPKTLQLGDIIAYRQTPSAKPVLHRIVDITTVDGELRFVVQGDQNVQPDSVPVSLSGPGDKVVYMIPYAGYILNFTSSALGRVLLIGVPLPALLFAMLTPARRARRNAATAQTSASRETTRPIAANLAPSIAPVTSLPLEASDRVSRARPSLEAQAVELRVQRERQSLIAQALERGLLPKGGRLMIAASGGDLKRRAESAATQSRAA